MTYRTYNRTHASSGTAWASKTSEQKLAAVFNTEEELEVAVSLDREIRDSKKTCMECASTLILANHAGDKMDTLADLYRKGAKFGWSDKQHTFAADILLKHMPRLLELIAATASGEEVVEPVAMTMRGDVEVRRVPGVKVAESATENNPNFGMF